MRTGAAGRDIPTFEIWDVEAGRQVANLPAHAADIEPFSCSTDGRKIVTGGADNITRQWEIFPWIESEYPGPASAELRSRIRDYARRYWHERLAAEAEAVGHSEPARVNIVRFDASTLPPRDPHASARLLDLTRHYNSRLDRPAVLRWAYDIDDDLRNLPPGVADYAGVPFDARGVMQLRQKHRWGGVFRVYWNIRPLRVDGIPVGQRVRRLHLLHGTANIDEEGTAIATLVWRYADGRSRESEIVYGRHVRDWWIRNDDRPTSEARVGWEGTNPVAEESYRASPFGDPNQKIRLYMATWDNPRPEAEVESLDFVSRDEQSAPFVVGMTVE